MKGTYRCTNVKFCMEDETQRRAWEYLHGLNRKDGSYGKVLSEALIKVLDMESELPDRKCCEDKKKSHEQDFKMPIQEVAEETARIVLAGIKEFSREEFMLQNATMVQRGAEEAEQK